MKIIALICLSCSLIITLIRLGHKKSEAKKDKNIFLLDLLSEVMSYVFYILMIGTCIPTSFIQDILLLIILFSTTLILAETFKHYPSLKNALKITQHDWIVYLLFTIFFALLIVNKKRTQQPHFIEKKVIQNYSQELLEKLFALTMDTPSLDAKTFQESLSIFLQGASLEGIHNQLIFSSSYAELEKKTISSEKAFQFFSKMFCSLQPYSHYRFSIENQELVFTSGRMNVQECSEQIQSIQTASYFTLKRLLMQQWNTVLSEISLESLSHLQSLFLSDPQLQAPTAWISLSADERFWEGALRFHQALNSYACQGQHPCLKDSNG